MSAGARLSPDDADFVDVIHTDGDVLINIINITI